MQVLITGILCFQFYAAAIIVLPMKRNHPPVTKLSFTALALVMLVFVKVVLIDGIDQYRAVKPALQAHQQHSSGERAGVLIEEDRASVAVLPRLQSPQRQRDMKSFRLDFEGSLPQPQPQIKGAENRSLEPRGDILKTTPKTIVAEVIDRVEPSTTQSSPPPRQALPSYPSHSGETAKVVIIIDDMGMARRYSFDTLDLPAPLTLAFLPYAPNLSELTVPAKKKGHELIIHVPMEPMDSSQNMGPSGLTTKMSKDEFMDVLDNHVFTAFEGYVGINNHMGSRLTQNERAMGWVMEALKARGLFFVDSKTIGSSVGARKAFEAGVPYAERDVFLDHYDTYEAVIKALGELERTAHRQGVAIAIGHPRKHTLEALRDWMPSMKERGLELVPVSAVLHHPAAKTRQETAKISVDVDNNRTDIEAE